MTPEARAFAEARDLLLALRGNPEAARARFRWPNFEHFNWAIDYFDAMARDNAAVALRIVRDSGPDEIRSFAELSRRSNQVANRLRRSGLKRGDALLVMLGNVPELWETLLGAMKAGLILIPTTTLLKARELDDRLERGRAAGVVVASSLTERFAHMDARVVRLAVGDPVPGWYAWAETASEDERFEPEGPTRADSPLFHYFTSGTTSLPKLVEHSHRSYPLGHLTTMYWLGLKHGDIHLNISSPGWAKHAWSSLFAPWNAGASIVALDHARFDVARVLEAVERIGVTTLCAPPTVWRAVVQAPLARYRLQLREVASAGEPLNPEVIAEVERAWGLTIRDGFGQTETTALIANPPGLAVRPGAMGCCLPGYDVVLLDANGEPAAEGEVCVRLAPRPAGLMNGYRTSDNTALQPLPPDFYRTGDVARRDTDGYLTFVGRADDVFKSSDYRISPFELESVLIEHAAVVEAAVVPSPDPRRLCVPKAFVVLAAGHAPTAETAASILAHARERLSPFKRVRRIQFADLPKTVSGKIRRTELRQGEAQRDLATRLAREFWEEDLPGAG